MKFECKMCKQEKTKVTFCKECKGPICWHCTQKHLEMHNAKG